MHSHLLYNQHQATGGFEVGGARESLAHVSPGTVLLLIGAQPFSKVTTPRNLSLLAICFPSYFEHLQQLAPFL